MRKSKKVLSVALAALMATSSMAAAAVVTASAEDVDTKIYFEVPTLEDWGTTKNVYCHLYSVYGNQTALTETSWQAKKEQCKAANTEKTVYYFDTASLGTIEEGADYALLFSTKDTDNKPHQTCNITLGYDCLGDTVYLTGDMVENTEDSEKLDYEGAWRNNSDKYGAKAAITSTGKVVGKYFPAHQPKAQQLAIAFKNYLPCEADAHSTNEGFFKLENNLVICDKLGVAPIDVYRQYEADYAELLEAADPATPTLATVQERLGLSDEDVAPVEETTAEPTTEEPTTEEPTTEEPTTEEPTTEEPTTEEVTTEPEPTTEPAPVDVYSIAGNKAAIFGAEWDASNTTTDMTLVDGLYTITFADVQPQDGIQFKVVKNHSWDEAWGDENGNNVTFNVVTACDVTVTFNEETKEINVFGDGVEIPKELVIDKIAAVGNGEDTWLNGVSWNPDDEANTMTEIADGIYEIIFEEIAEFDNYEFKFAANGAWVDNWGIADGETAVIGEAAPATFNGNNIAFEVPYEMATVKLTLDLREFNYSSKAGAMYQITIIDTTPQPPTTEEPTTEEPTTEPAPVDVYSIAGNKAAIFGAEWDASNTTTDMTLVDGLYTITFTDVQPQDGIQFKVVKNHSWDEAWGDENGNNVTFNVVTACDVTVTFNEETKEINVFGDGVEIPKELVIDKIAAVGNGEDTWLNGVSWNPDDDANTMTEVSDRVYEIVFEEIAEFDNYEFKFAANGAWVDNWGIADGETAVIGEAAHATFNGNNIAFEVPYEMATVKLTLDLSAFDYASKTGATYKIEITDTTPSPVGEVADIDGDSVISIQDATLIQKAGLGISVPYEVTLENADINGDGRISILDVTCVQKYIARMSKGLGRLAK